MPVYQVAHAGIPFTLLQRDAIARGITRIHHEVTNAPEPFVRVAFQPMPFGNIYTAGEVEGSIVVFGNVRAGRSELQRRQLVQGCYDVVREASGAHPSQIVVGLNELPSSWLMEAGFFMPEPTDEAESAWIAGLQETFPGQFDAWGGGGKHPEIVTTVDDEATRLEQLRHLSERYLTIARGQGHDVRTLLGQLTELVDSSVEDHR
jgi:phenylpyruvate tautomerase PptA (4-oxalocrotonate tautomerase family)